VPPNIWRPKPVDHHIPLDYSNDINNNVFEFEQHGKAFCHQPEPFCIERNDIHIWNQDRDFAEFKKNFVAGADADANADPATLMLPLLPLPCSVRMAFALSI
jgi:hypothetical protein